MLESVGCLVMNIVWQRIGGKSRGSGQLVNWLVVHMFYAVADFMMLNAINLGWFATLTLWHTITPHKRTHWFTTARECDFFKFSLHDQTRAKV